MAIVACAMTDNVLNSIVSEFFCFYFILFFLGGGVSKNVCQQTLSKLYGDYPKWLEISFRFGLCMIATETDQTRLSDSILISEIYQKEEEEEMLLEV